MSAAVTGADLVCVLTEWAEFRNADPRAVGELVAGKLREKHTPVERDYAAAPLRGQLDEDQLRQVFVNLLAGHDRRYYEFRTTGVEYGVYRVDRLLLQQALSALGAGPLDPGLPNSK